MPSIDKELNRLVKSFDAIYNEWVKALHTKTHNNSKEGADADQYNAAVIKCSGLYQALMPENVDIPQISAWVEPHLWQDFTIWNALRASALYCKFPAVRKGPAFVFHMAGKELAMLKAGPSRNTRRIVPEIYALMKPKLTKVSKQIEEADSEVDEFATPLEDAPSPI